MNTENLKDEIIRNYQAQCENYKRLMVVNDSIIEKQKEYITKLEGLLSESKQLLEETLQLLKQTNYGTSN